MFHNRQGKILVILVVLALVVAVAVIVASKPNPAAAQIPPAMDEAPPPPPEPGPGNYMQPPPPQMNQMNWRRQSPMMGMASSGAAAISAAGEYVYVVQGNTLYQFSARTLKLVNKTEFVQTTNRPTYPQENANPPRPAPER